ncbi:Hypothetical protein A7982_02622 [Minicystis rosea]|nr:Hypothetical protein A7982_02622 [Minicystis rosea]
MRSQSITMGRNRTGVRTSPIDSADVVRTARATCVEDDGDGRGLAQLRRSYESEAGSIGSIPLPTTLRGAFHAAFDLLRGRRTAALVDTLGERLAFERMTTRLYEALLTKHDDGGSWPGGPARVELAEFHDEELSHVGLLRGTIAEIGADPTVETPAADVMSMAASGLIQVATDPRTTLDQALHALLAAELYDNDGWQMLIDAARADGKEGLVPRFQRAQQAEAIHLRYVRRWLGSAVDTEARVDDEAG